MHLRLSLVLLGGVAFATGAFLPTKTGSTDPSEIFWFQDDSGAIKPAFLHGNPPNWQPRAIEDDVSFHLYNSKTPGSNIIITPGCNGCLATLVPGAPVVIFAHGFSSSHEGGFGDGLRENFARAPEVMNLIFINWSKLAPAPWYEFAANNVKPVGEYSGRLVNFLVQSGVPMSSISFAGHSLGSHVANFIAATLNPGLSLPVIHALDPALPLFGVRDDTERIDPSDGDFVNVIHSAMGTLLDGGLAFTEPRGHVDFYPNSGKNQPGCGADAFGACSHSRAHEYFGESAYRREAFASCMCESWQDYNSGTCTCPGTSQVMGWATPTSAPHGIYYLRTNAASPFGI